MMAFVTIHICNCHRRVKENEQKKKEAKEKGIKVTCKRMVRKDDKNERMLLLLPLACPATNSSLGEY